MANMNNVTNSGSHTVFVRSDTEKFRVAKVGSIPCCFSMQMVVKEFAIASACRLLAVHPPPWTSKILDIPAAITKEQGGHTLSRSQFTALETTLRSKFSLITGGPGVGKTTILENLVRVLSVVGMHVVLCAPTGRAAQRLENATGAPATTIHRLLKIDFNGEGGLSMLNADVVIVDEASMVDIKLMYSLITRIPPHAALIIVGDTDQLPPVVGHLKKKKKKKK